MIVEKRRLSELKPMEDNPRKISEEQMRALEASMEKFGYVEPIVWNKRTGHVISGHQRLKVLQAKGGDSADVVVVDFDEAQERALNLAMNKISGDWDEEKLSTFLKEIQKSDEKLIEITGFEEEELQNFLLFSEEDKFKRPDFQEIVDKFNIGKGKTEKNENWFFIEFYGDDEKFAEISKIIKANMRTNHEILPDFFEKLVMKYG
jgi:ParB-like chromosome segregation protein Spo0J